MTSSQQEGRGARRRGHPPRPAARRTSPRRPGRAAARFALYLVACWSAIAVVAWGAFPGAPWLVLGAAAYATVPLLAFMRHWGWPFYPTAAFRLAVVRVVLYAQLVLPVVAAAALLGLLAGAPFGASLAVGRVAALVVLAAMVVFLLAGYAGSRRLVVREIEASIPGLPPEFDGMRIAQISDLHVGPHTSRGFLRRVTTTIRALAPDLVAVTGDLVDDRAEDVGPLTAMLSRIAAPFGVYVIAGNHDIYAGWEEVERGLRRLPAVRVLVNDAHLICRDGATLALVGTGDPAGRRLDAGGAAPDVERAFARVPRGATVVALAHNPALWPQVARRGAALTLSGHTHWGQLALPRRRWSLASPFNPHAMGAYQEGDALLYITPGTGYWGIPFRLGAYPEVTMVTLRRGVAAVRMAEAKGA